MENKNGQKVSEKKSDTFWHLIEHAAATKETD